MNERIRELAEQAGEYANESTKDFTGDEPVVWMDYYTEKFAELIVMECAKISEEHFYHGSAGAMHMKQHFGVDDESED